MATNPLFLNDDEATPFSHAHTYIAGEDNSRLASAARQFGLHQIRQPLGNVRALAQAILRDSTLESARMHSVGALGSDEHVDDTGTLHITTLTRRTKTPQAPPGDYGTLQDLFRQPAAVVLPEEEEEYEDQVEGGSLTAAIFGIIKGTVGPAILYLPRGFSLAGWIVAIVSMLIATTSFLYSSRRLLQCWRVEKTKVEKLQEIKKLLLEDEQHDNTTILLTYPELARRAFGSWAAFVQFGIAGMQFGVCLTYLIFVPQNLVESTRVLFGLEVDSWVFLLCMLMIEIPLTWIRDIRRLTYTNILATVLIAYGLASCLAIALHQTFQDPSTNLWQRLVNLPATNDTWYLFVGTSVSYEYQLSILL
jgi:proton-coupled amino acid transporter